MEATLLCDPCGEGNKVHAATKFCSDCEEKFCKECAESHCRFKASKAHILIDLSTTNSMIPPSSNTECQIHPDFKLDLFCSEHSSLCCVACIHDEHQNCRNVLPISEACKNINGSNLLLLAFQELNDMSIFLKRLHTKRKENQNFIESKKSSITMEISSIKSRLIEYINNLEKHILCDLGSVCERNLTKIQKETDEILCISSTLNDRKHMLEFARDCCSNNHLFRVLHMEIKENSKTLRKIQDMISNIREIDILFEKSVQLKLHSFGSVCESVRPLSIQQNISQPGKVGKSQDRLLNQFEKDGNVELKSNVSYEINGIAVTMDSKLVFCNFHSDFQKLYVYKDCETYENEITFSSPPFDVAVIPMTCKAVVTLPVEQSVQIICTGSYTKGDKFQIGEACYGIATAIDRIFVGAEGTIYILDFDGVFLSQVKTKSPRINNLFFDQQNNHILVRCPYNLCCLSMDGKVIYQFNVSGNEGLTVDNFSNVYTSGYYTNDIRRFSHDGQRQEIVVNKDDGIFKPCHIVFNSNCSNLFVVNNHKSVAIYRCG